MAIDHKKKLIFIHIPKTAGTSVYKSLDIKDISYNNKFLGHKSIEDYKKQYQNYWENYLKFTIVRDPIDRFISAYKFARMDESFWHSIESDKLPKHDHYEICNSLDINQYTLYLYNNPKNHSLHTLPQIWFIQNINKKIEVNYIAKYENLISDLKKINIFINEKLNVSYVDDINVIKLSNNSKKMLREMYRIDYNFFYMDNNEETFSYS